MTAKRIAFLGIMLAIVLVLAALESLLMPLPLLPPYVKPGLSNIVIMYCVLCGSPQNTESGACRRPQGRSNAVTLAVLKSVFVFITRGPVAGLLSLCGGLLSVAVIILLVKLIPEKKLSYSAISVSGACAHNLGQLAAAALLLNMPLLVYYLPVLIISGIGMGLLTGALLKILMPIMLEKLPRLN